MVMRVVVVSQLFSDFADHAVIQLTHAQAMVPAFLSSCNNSMHPLSQALYLQVLLQTKAHGNDTLILDSPSLYPHFSQPKIGACLNRE